MSLGEWMICGVIFITIISIIVIVIKEKKNSRKVKTNIDEKVDTFICYEKVILSKKIVDCQWEGLSLPQAIIQYGCVFLLENGEEKFYFVPEEVFNKLTEQTKGNLYINNNSYFDFEVKDW